MKRNLFTLAFVLIVMSMVLAACAGAAPTESAPQETVAAEPAQPEATAAPAAPSGYGETMSAVQARGRLVCGVNGQQPGFSSVDPSGAYTGLDVDFCK
ncbi:MAG: amino acid ABC transporter substrate-binding protein, partial [Anaerolineales bacterium]